MLPDQHPHDDSAGISPAPSQSREELYGDFVRLIARHDQAIRRFVRSLLPSSDGVDDVVQETALECWKKYDSFQPKSPSAASDEFIRWACVIARYKVLSWQRDNARDRLVFREGVVEQLAQTAMENLIQHDRERTAVESCLSELPTDQRRLVLSVHSPGESVARIAQETGVQSRRLYSKVNLLRRRLLECVHSKLAEEF